MGKIFINQLYLFHYVILEHFVKQPILTNLHQRLMYWCMFYLLTSYDPL